MGHIRRRQQNRQEILGDVSDAYSRPYPLRKHTTGEIRNLRGDAVIYQMPFAILICPKEDHSPREGPKHSWNPTAVETSPYTFLAQNR